MCEQTIPEIEEWRPVPGYPNYEASSLGRVRSLDQRVGARNGGVAVRRGRVLAQATKSNGYLQVTLCDPHAARRCVLVHQLVLETFVGPAPPGHEGAHWDGVRTNNRTSNLRWATRKENDADKERHGTRARHERHGMAKLNKQLVSRIREAQGSAPSAFIADALGITPEHVWVIWKGRAWRGV